MLVNSLFTLNYLYSFPCSENDPLQEIIKRGDIPSAEAIYAARKRRQAARERGSKTVGPGKDFI